jgi:hypothetical protein
MAYPSNAIDTTGMTMDDVEQACSFSWLLSQIWECRHENECRTKNCYYFHIGDLVWEPPAGVCPYHFYNGFCKWNDKKKRNPNNPRFKPCKHPIHICKDDYIEQIEEKIKWEKENKIDNEVIVNEVIDSDGCDSDGYDSDGYDNEVIDNEVIVNEVDSDGYDIVEVVETDDEENDEENEVVPPPNDIATKLAPESNVIWEKCAWLEKYEEQ